MAGKRTPQGKDVVGRIFRSLRQDGQWWRTVAFRGKMPFAVHHAVRATQKRSNVLKKNGVKGGQAFFWLRRFCWFSRVLMIKVTFSEWRFVDPTWGTRKPLFGWSSYLEFRSYLEPEQNQWSLPVWNGWVFGDFHPFFMCHDLVCHLTNSRCHVKLVGFSSRYLLVYFLSKPLSIVQVSHGSYPK